MDTGSSGSSSSDAKLNAPCILILYEGAKQRELGGINGGGGGEKAGEAATELALRVEQTGGI